MVITNSVCGKEYDINKDSADSSDCIMRKMAKTTKAKKKMVDVNKTSESSKGKCSIEYLTG